MHRYHDSLLTLMGLHINGNRQFPTEQEWERGKGDNTSHVFWDVQKRVIAPWLHPFILHVRFEIKTATM